MATNNVLDGLFGLCVGDALGVPVESRSREHLEKNPVQDMVGYGSHNQPPGTWSDDSSLAFCLAESLCKGFDLGDLADRFCRWRYEGYWTPYGTAFGIGHSTRQAIKRLREGVDPVMAGGCTEWDNGNGSLMRILPLVFHVKNMDADEKFRLTRQVSSLTHRHPRTMMVCSIYVQVAINLLEGDTPTSAYHKMKDVVVDFYQEEPYSSEFSHFSQILHGDISTCSKNDIQSSGYVIHTLEAVLWCLFNNDSYEDTVLSGINLGGDTDTTGAVVGGLAGILYGFDAIPPRWVVQIARKDDIIDLVRRLDSRLSTD